MPEIRTIQNSFNAGELSPLIRGRIDQVRYFNGLDTCLNWIPLVPGGIRVRGGFKFAGSVKTAGKKTYCVPFTASATASYILEFGDLYIRIWGYDVNGEPDQIDIAGTPVEVTTTYVEADLPYIQCKQTGDTMYLTHDDYAPAKLERLSDTSWRLTAMSMNVPPTYEGKTDLLTTMYSSHATGAGRTLTSGGTTAADKFYAGDRARYVVTNDGGLALITAVPTDTTLTVDILEGSFKLVGAPYASGEWWLTGSPTMVFSTTLPVTLGAVATVVARNSVGGAAVDAFRTVDVGKYIHALGGSIKIATHIDTTSVSGPVKSILSDGLSTPANAVGGDWTLERVVWTGAAYYPRNVTIGEQRVWYAGAAYEPDTVRATVIGDYQNFAPGVNDDLACKYIIAADDMQSVQWLDWWKGLVLGCLKKIIILSMPTSQGFTPTDPPSVSEYAMGCDPILPFRAGNNMLFVEVGGRRVLQLQYNYLSDNYDMDDLCAFADHLTWTYTFTAGAWAPTPSQVAYYRRSDGTICALTYAPKEKVAGWSRLTTSTAAGQSDVESVATVFNPVKKRYELWAAIKRTVNAAVIRNIEVLDPDKFLDSSYTYSGAATATITGLTHLVGETVSVKTSTRIYPGKVITAGGEVTGLSPTVTAAEVGIPFTATATTCRVEQAGGPTLQGRVKAIGPVTLRCLNMPVVTLGGVRYKAKGIVAGYSSPTVYTIPTTDAISTSTVDGDLEVLITGYDKDGRVTIVQDLPLGGTVTMLESQVSIGD